MVYDRTRTCTNINECRKDLFSRKRRLPEELAPTLDVFNLHVNRAVYQASYFWAQSLLKDPVLPDPNEWGWKLFDEGFNLVWSTPPEASKICQELIRCGCNIEKAAKDVVNPLKPP